MEFSSEGNSRKWKLWGSWIAQVLIAFAFLAAGSQKLLGADDMVQLFAQIGIGSWFQYVTGGLEVIAAILLLIPATTTWGATLAACIMVGAVFTHIAVIGGSFIPALVLLLLALTILWLRRDAAT